LAYIPHRRKARQNSLEGVRKEMSRGYRDVVSGKSWSKRRARETGPPGVCAWIQVLRSILAA
jgi:hypothetical protein